jgi:cullin-associated NEDD8-dissociated protein 1
VRIPYITAASAPLQTSSLNCLIRILSTSRPSIRKRCIAPLSALVFISPKLFDSSLRDRIIEGLENGGDTGRIWVGVVASLARGRSASKIGALIGEGQVIEMIMKQTRDVEDTEAVKGALVVSLLHLVTLVAEV